MILKPIKLQPRGVINEFAHKPQSKHIDMPSVLWRAKLLVLLFTIPIGLPAAERLRGAVQSNGQRQYERCQSSLLR